MRRDAKGFTLIEVMVVVVLIAIVTSLAVVRIDPPDAGPEREARRLARVLDMARRTAVLEGRTLGLVVSSGGYRFVRRGSRGWQRGAFPDDDALRTHRLAEGLRLNVDTGELPGPREPGADDETGRPHLLILSSGEITPFEFEVRPADGRAPSWQITGTVDGRIDYREGAHEP